MGSATTVSWESLVSDHSPRVYRLAFRLTGNPYDAEDLTQEVFVRAFRALPTFSPGNVPAWLHRITTNLFLDQARRRTRIRFDPLGNDEVGASPLDLAPESHVTSGMFDPDVEEALQSLPPDFRVAVVLCDIEGLSYEEIADALDTKVGTIRSRIHRGRTMLRRALAHRAPAEGRLRYSGPVDPVMGGIR
jgi:RNA polymerase sigma-70 factor (ECF subfamily)